MSPAGLAPTALACAMLALAAPVGAETKPAGSAAPVRVATLLPFVADAVERVGGDVVATVRRDLEVAPPPPMIDLGSPHSPSLEALATAKADVVVGERALHGPQRDALVRGGGDLLLVDTSSVGATLDGLLEVGRRIGAADGMSAAVRGTRETLAGSRLARRVPALVVFGAPGSFMVVTRRTWLGDLVATVGFENLGAGVVGAERHPGFVQVSDETLAGLRPEVVLLVAHGDPEALRAAFTRRLAEGGPWRGLADAKHGVHVLPVELFATNPGLDLANAARHLHDLVEPRVGRGP